MPCLDMGDGPNLLYDLQSMGNHDGMRVQILRRQHMRMGPNPRATSIEETTLFILHHFTAIPMFTTVDGF